jgi:hypothetical protein
MPSMLASVRAVPVKAWLKLVAAQPSKKLAGKLVKEEQSNHASRKSVPLLVSISGKLVSEEQLRHAPRKLVPLLVLISGKLVSEEHPNHALEKGSPAARVNKRES